MKKWIVFVFLFMVVTTFGQNTYVISLDGAESFFVNDDANNHLDLTGSYTFECWINVDSYQQYDRIFDRRTVCEMSIYAPGGSGDFRLRYTERGSSHNILRNLTTTNDLSLDTWYHIAVTFDNNTNICRLYVNNSLEASETNANWSLTASTNALNIGGLYNNGYHNQIDALIDEFRVSNIARAIGDMQTSTSDAAYSSDNNTVLLMHLDDQGDPPTYVSGIGLSGTTGDDNITSSDYITPSDLPLPVELTSFTAKVIGNKVVLNWRTASENNNYGFEVEKTQVGVAEWKTLGFVEGNGNSNSPKDYLYIDHTSSSGVISYRLKQIDTDGAFEYSDIVTVKLKNNDEFALSQNHPNPFNPTTVIGYEIGDTRFITLKIYNSIGQEIITLVNKEQSAGSYEVVFNANNLPSGIYFYSLIAGDFVSVRKMMLLK